jgi:DNA-binding NarL/FixJ family response regulator
MNAANSTIPVVALTLNEEERTIVRLFRLGVKGYLSKNCSAAVLQEALKEVFSRGYYHNDFMTLSLRMDTPKARKSDRENILEKLSVKEKQFLKLVCHESEYTYEQLADKMGISVRQADGCREELFSKFGIKSKTGLVLFVLKHKLMDHL